MAKGIDAHAIVCEAWTVEVGDVLVNLGKVVARTEVGVFTVFAVVADVASLASGRIDRVTVDVARHSHDHVMVGR